MDEIPYAALVALWEGIDFLLRCYNPDDDESIMFLCAYRRFLDVMDDEVVEAFADRKNKLETLFDSLSAERLKNAADQFDPYRFLAAINKDKEQDQNGETNWEINSRLYLLLEDGFAVLVSYLNRVDLIQAQAKRISEVLNAYGWGDAFGNYHDYYGVAHSFDVPESQNVRRLRDEIDLFLQNYDPDNNEQVILLFAYRRIIDGFAGTTKQYLTGRRLRIESLVKSLTSEHLVWCATLFDFDLYFNRFVDNYEKWEKYEITLMELVDSAVYSIVLLDGLGELARYLGDDTLSMDDCADQYTKQYRFSEYFVWIPMFNEYDRRYGFDSRYAYDNQLDDAEAT